MKTRVKSYSYMRNGRHVYVPSHITHYTGSRRSRGSKSALLEFRGVRPWITRKGKLGGPGFFKKSLSMQKDLLTQCIKKYGRRSCLGSVRVLGIPKRSMSLRPRIATLSRYIKTYSI